MQLSKMTAGTDYAVTGYRDGSYCRRFTLLSSELYTTCRNSPDIIKAHSGARATIGAGYARRSVGVLMENPAGKQTVVYPQHVKMTWEEYTKKQSAEKVALTLAQEAEKAQAEQNAKNAATLKVLWERLNLPNTYFSPYRGSVEIRYETLIELISQATAPTQKEN